MDGRYACYWNAFFFWTIWSEIQSRSVRTLSLGIYLAQNNGWFRVKLRSMASTFGVLSHLTRSTNCVNSVGRISWIIKIESFHRKSHVVHVSRSDCLLYVYCEAEIYPSFLWLVTSQSSVNEEFHSGASYLGAGVKSPGLGTGENPQKNWAKTPIKEPLRWLFRGRFTLEVYYIDCDFSVVNRNCN